MRNFTAETAAQRNKVTGEHRTRTLAKRFTLSWGWFLAPLFGAAGSGGLEYEPLPISRKKSA
ncbi:MAG TPA: hypothetical protein VJ672_12915 [Gemmatimonadaceae bacterium]|nr:hypothetical protein [Gemmatimonadaceae bacterium]